jgi:hypothetical protein
MAVNLSVQVNRASITLQTAVMQSAHSGAGVSGRGGSQLCTYVLGYDGRDEELLSE